MSWRIKEIKADEDGTITSMADITHIIGDFTIEQTLGDAMFVQGGDINLKHREPFSGDWLFFYFDEQLVDAFRINKPYDAMNIKLSHRYESRLSSIQKLFFDWISECPVTYVTDPTHINYGLSMNAATLTIKRLDFYCGGTHYIDDDRYGFSLIDMIKSIHGKISLGYDYKYNFYLDTVDAPGPILDEDDLPIIYRGSSVSILNDVVDAIEYTFSNYNVMWLDIFKLGIYGFYSFIKVTPKIMTGGALGIVAVDVQLVPKINISPGTITTPKWLDQKYIPELGRIDRIRLYSSIEDKDNLPSFDLAMGLDSSQGIRVFEKSIAAGNHFADYFTWPHAHLFLSAGTYIIAESKYQIDSVYFTQPLILPYYQGMLGVGFGNGYSGKFRFNAEHAGGHIYAGSDVAQIYRLTINRDAGGAVASVEGLKIA